MNVGWVDMVVDWNNEHDCLRWDSLQAIDRSCAKRRMLPGEREILARAIADHLKLVNWKITRGPPAKPHGGRY